MGGKKTPGVSLKSKETPDNSPGAKYLRLTANHLSGYMRILPITDKIETLNLAPKKSVARTFVSVF
jgi:hypothetical protein